MPTIDPVVLRLSVDLSDYQARLMRAEAVSARTFRGVSLRAEDMARQIRASTSAISTSLTALSGGFAAAFTAKQVADLADGYTKFTNQLKVAGLEGQALGKVQEDLFGVAQKYGTQLESVGTLYSRLSGSAKELGLSETQLLQFVEGTSAALKVSGQSAGEAQGALLQLSQALGGSKIQAEEYNSLIDGARPLLQAVANGSDRFAGSVSKLTAAVKDGKVSTQEFVEAGLRGMPQLVAQAEKASLTIGASFTTLNNALGKYIGQTDASLSATERVSAAIQSLSENLDTVIPAITVLVGLIGARYVAAAGLATVATVAKTAADVREALAANAVATAHARLNPLLLSTAASATAAAGSVTGLSVATGVAARGMAGLVAVLGGPVGIALTALAIGFGVAAARAGEATQAASAYRLALTEAEGVTKKASDATDKLASAHGKARKEALAAARAEQENTKQKLASAQASLLLAEVEAARARAHARTSVQEASRSVRGAGGIDSAAIAATAGNAAVAQAEANAKAAEQTVIELSRSLAETNRLISAAEKPITTSASDDDKPKKKAKGPSGPSGRSAAEIAADQERELSRLRMEELQARLDLATDVEKRADLQKAILAEEYAARVTEINAKEDLNKAQKAAQIKALEPLYGSVTANGDDVTVTAPGLYARQAARDIEQRRNAISAEALASEREALEAEADLIVNRKDRLAAEHRILDIVDEEARLRLDAQIASGDIADAAKARADLERRLTARREQADRSGESPMQSYRREIADAGNQINDSLEDIQVSGLKSLNDGLAEAIAGTRSLGDVFDDVAGQIITALVKIAIQQAIIKPLSELFGGESGGSSGKSGGGILSSIGSAIGGLFGRASGGYVAPGQTVRVNEHAGGVELLRMGSSGGTVIPLGQVNQTLSPSSAPASVTQILNFDNRNAVMTSDLLAQMNAMAQQAAMEGASGGRALAAQDIRAMQRRRL